MSEKVPLPLQKGQPYHFLKPTWTKMGPPYNKHFPWLIYGESGTGKSYVSGGAAEAFFPDFDVNESFAFTPEQFVNITKKKHKKRFPVILDDAGLSAFSGDALSRQVKLISKISQSIRYKNWAIILNIPDIGLLAKSVRITNHFVSKPMWIDYEKELCYITFQKLVKGIFSEKMFRHNQVYYKRTLNQNTGYTTIQKTKKAFHPLPIPSKRFIKEYEKLKDENMQAFRDEGYNDIIAEKKKETLKRSRYTTNQLVEMIEADKSKYLKDGELYFPLIMREFGVSHMTARNAIKVATS